ncbi:MAG TPA: hypothetical protein VHX62_02665 [Solirubrobacteraceae bacterium]|nr:hypothetical protein [Solirubrobacteraceae bacterium]
MTTLVLAILVMALPSTALAATVPNPIVRVLRPDDVPGSTNEYLPSGDLQLGEFADLVGGTSQSKLDLRHTLQTHHFQTAAITAYAGPWPRSWLSFAIELANPSSSRTALAGVVSAAGEGVPTGARMTVTSESGFSDARLVTFTGSRTGFVGDEIIVSQGSYLYALSEQQKVSLPRVASLRALLSRIITRS